MRFGRSRINIVRERLVAHARLAVQVRFERYACRQVQREIDRIKKSDRAAQRVPNRRHRIGVLRGEKGAHGGEDRGRGVSVRVAEAAVDARAGGDAGEERGVERVLGEVDVGEDGFAGVE